MLKLHKIWIDQCEAARGIENEFGTVPAMKYLVGEKFMNYLECNRPFYRYSLQRIC